MTDGYVPHAPRTPGSVTACRPDQVWALDYLFDATADGRPIKILNITDEHSREALACHAARSINADQTISVLESLVETPSEHPSTFVATTAPNSSPRHSKSGAATPAPLSATSNPVPPGRTRSSSPSTATSAASSSTWSSPTASTKPRSWSKTGDTSTTTTDPTSRSATKPQQPSPAHGMLPTNRTLITSGPTNGVTSEELR